MYFIILFFLEGFQTFLLVNTCAVPLVTFFFGLFATGILSNSDRGDHYAATDLLFDVIDAGGKLPDI